LGGTRGDGPGRLGGAAARRSPSAPLRDPVRRVLCEGHGAGADGGKPPPVMTGGVEMAGRCCLRELICNRSVDAVGRQICRTLRGSPVSDGRCPGGASAGWLKTSCIIRGRRPGAGQQGVPGCRGATEPAALPSQAVFVVVVIGCVHLVPFVEEPEYIFLRTIIPSRKATLGWTHGGAPCILRGGRHNGSCCSQSS
jgi:hypothetical protein